VNKALIRINIFRPFPLGVMFHIANCEKEWQIGAWQRKKRVLCFERKLLEELGVFQGLSLEVEKHLAVVTSSSNLRYRNRSEAEQDKRFKQLIPYVLIICNGKILRYRRAEVARKHDCTDCIPLELGGTFQRKMTDFFRLPLAIGTACGAK